MADRHRAIRSKQEHANPETGAHVTTAKPLISPLQRALVGAYPNLGRKHL